MASSKLCAVVLLAVLSVWVVVDGASDHRNAAAPAPASVDCTSLVMNMAECLSFVSNGSTTARPEGTCCSGLKLVLKTNAECLCEMYKSSASYGVVLNMTRAVALPAACKIHASPAADCGLALAPTAAPATPPSVPTSGSGNEQAPAPSPPRATSGSQWSSTISVGCLLIGLAIASFYSF